MNNKRETLKKVAGVSAVAALAPSAWTKPVLNSVVLPAHAQTSVQINATVEFFNFQCSSTGQIVTNYLIQVTPAVEGLTVNLKYFVEYTDITQVPVTLPVGQTNSSGQIVVLDSFGFPSENLVKINLIAIIEQPDGRILRFRNEIFPPFSC